MQVSIKTNQTIRLETSIETLKQISFNMEIINEKWNSYSQYEEYLKNCKKEPRSFSQWLILKAKLKHHRELIRPMIKFWQK